MKRRDFINTGLITALTGAIATPTVLSGCTNKQGKAGTTVKNIIFLVSDGMSVGTLNMADLLLQRKEGKGSTWIDLYRQNKAKKAYMDTASNDSLVTDSAAASSSWGGGRRVKNGSLNVNSDGTFNKPILQKFKDAGKAVGCVTTVPITHATPAGFSVNMKHRNMQDKIASKYLDLKFDVMMGGGSEYFDGSKRDDKKNIFGDFEAAGFQVVKTKSELGKANASQPIIGVFSEGGLPYAVDMDNDAELKSKIPTLAEMTSKAIEVMANNPAGFVLQVEGGKVDWAAHANDTAALLYDQIAFDEAVTAAINFAEQRDDTLVVITTDHGNASPGLIKNAKANQMFDTLKKVKHSNDWVLHGISNNDKPKQVIERLNYAQGITISQDEAATLLKAYSSLDNNGIYNSYKLPFKQLAEVQQKYTSVYWAAMNHTAEFVELAMYGPGSTDLPTFIKNYELHNYLLEAAGVPIVS